MHQYAGRNYEGIAAIDFESSRPWTGCREFMGWDFTFAHAGRLPRLVVCGDWAPVHSLSLVLLAILQPIRLLVFASWA